MTEPMTDAELAEVRQQHAKWGLSTNPASDVVFDRLFARLDAERSARIATEAARDVALVRAMPEWQPIETAPHDVLVLLYCQSEGQQTRSGSNSATRATEAGTQSRRASAGTHGRPCGSPAPRSPSRPRRTPPMTALDEIERDEDAHRDAIDERRAFLRATRCRCGDDMPGTCPGPAFCPLCQDEETPDAP